jgi:hypothetical protein
MKGFIRFTGAVTLGLVLGLSVVAAAQPGHVIYLTWGTFTGLSEDAQNIYIAGVTDAMAAVSETPSLAWVSRITRCVDQKQFPTAEALGAYVRGDPGMAKLGQVLGAFPAARGIATAVLDRCP